MWRYAAVAMSFWMVGWAEASPPLPVTRFRDCAECPEMVVIAAGRFVMGSPEDEEGRSTSEGPQRSVTVPPFALGRFEVTRGEFAAFVHQSGHRSAGCRLWSEPEQWRVEWTRDWRDPGYAQTDRHPVSCVNWYDARAYAAWLAQRTGRRYRLPSEAEWEYAARAGSNARYPWGDDAERACAHANIADLALGRDFPNWSLVRCDDGHAFTAPAGRFRANAFGVHDLIGSLWEWVDDCWNESYRGAPPRQHAWVGGDCGLRVLRGGSWFTAPRLARSASRFRDHRVHRFYFYGIRVAADL